MWLGNRERLQDLGYSRNPFEELPFSEFLEAFPLAPEFRDLLSQPFRILQIIGEAGFGKTTHLRQIEDYLGKEGIPCVYRYVAVGQEEKIPEWGDSRFLLLDEAQRLAAGILRETVSALRVVAGTHENLIQRLGSTDFPALTVELPPVTSGRLLHILQRRLDSASLSGKALHRFTQEAADSLFRKTRANLLSARLICYDLFLRDVIPSEIGAADLMAPVLPDPSCGYGAAR